ncbi:hypothetical protein [Glycomyces sp. MUSA5-2]|uniref:hypothetical protein n=1 Tax=Glycomyces sp. MUSA5-2 TaxID=2053002 RepID=UPI00300BE8B5
MSEEAAIETPARPHLQAAHEAAIAANRDHAVYGGMGVIMAVNKSQDPPTGPEEVLRADAVAAVAAIFEYAEVAGWYPELIVIEAIRLHAQRREAEIDAAIASGQGHFTCTDCGTQVWEIPRWYLRCHNCQRERNGQLHTGLLPYDESAIAEHCAAWAEIAVQAFSALTRKGWDYLSTDSEGREEILSDLIGDLGHLARRDGLDPDAIYQRGKNAFADEDQAEPEQD